MFPPTPSGLVRHSIIVLIFGLLLVLAGAFWLDLLLANFFALPELGEVYYYSREVTNIGDSIHYFILALIGWIFAKWIYSRSLYLQKKLSAERNQQIKAWSGFLIRSLLVCGLLLHVVKILVGRQRPHVAEYFYNLNFAPFNLHWHWQSFPSGHSQVLFTVATVLALRWPRGRAWFLLAALLFAYTRVTIHQHFFSDIIAGAVLGYLVTLWNYRRWPPKGL